MKRWISALVAMVLVFLCMCALAEDTASDGNERDDYVYDVLVDNTLGIARYTGTDGEVIIPSEINGSKVTVIEESCFEGCGSLTNVVIPEGVTTINKYAFWDCDGLVNMTIPESVTYIHRNAFQWNNKVVLTVIDDSYALQYCLQNRLDYLIVDSGESTVSASQATIENYAGMWTVKDSLLNDDRYIRLFLFDDGHGFLHDFDSSSGIRYVYPISCETNDDMLTVRFMEETKLTGTVSEGYKYTMKTRYEEPWYQEARMLTFERTALLDDSGFAYTLNREKTEASVEGYAEWIDTLEIPNTLGGAPVKGISSYAFNYYEDFKEIHVPEGVERIGRFAFDGCRWLKCLFLPQSATDIYSFADPTFGTRLSILPEKAKDAIIVAPKNSYAQVYAKECGIAFVPSETYVTPEEAAIAVKYYTGCWKIKNCTLYSGNTYTAEDCNAEDLRIYLLENGSALWYRKDSARSLTWDYQEQCVRLFDEGRLVRMLYPIAGDLLSLVRKNMGVYRFEHSPIQLNEAPIGEWEIKDLEKSALNLGGDNTYSVTLSADGSMRIDGENMDMIRMLKGKNVYQGFWVMVDDEIGFVMNLGDFSTFQLSLSDWSVKDGIFYRSDIRVLRLDDMTIEEPKPKK